MQETFYLINFTLVTIFSLVLVSRLCRGNHQNPASGALLRWLYGSIAWAFFDLAVTHTAVNYSQESAFFIYKLLSLSFVLMPGLGSELLLALIRPPTSKDRIFLYTPLVLLYLSQFFFPDLVGAQNFGIFSGSDKSPAPWNLAFFILASCYVGFLMPSFALNVIREPDQAIRQEKGLMLLSGLFVVGSIAVSHWHTATHGPHLPLFGNASCLAISLAAYWNIKKSGSLFPSRSRLEAIFEKSPSGFASLHRGRIMWANPGLADLLGLGGAEEVQGRQITDFLKKPTDSNDQDKIRKAFGANQEFLEQVSLAQAQGKEITCLAQAIRIDEKDPEKGVFLGMTDLLRINDLQNRLSHSESRYRALIEQAWELILVIKDEKIVFANSAALEFYGGAPGNNKPVELSQLIHPDHFKSTDEYLGGISEGQTLPDILRVRLINNNNESIWTDMVARAVDWEDGLALQVVFRNVDERIKLERKLEKLASTDPLTGADNRRTLHEKGQNELIRCRRYGSDMVVMMIDVDHFKKINDTMGHFLGDEVLKALVNHCQKTLRASDFFGRLGGEEFVAVLTESNIAQAHQVAQRLRQSLMQLKVAAEPKPVSFTVSIGLATNAPGDAFFEEILNRADKAMYLAKRRGRNQVAWLETEQQMEQAQKNDAK